MRVGNKFPSSSILSLTSTVAGIYCKCKTKRNTNERRNDARLYHETKRDQVPTATLPHGWGQPYRRSVHRPEGVDIPSNLFQSPSQESQLTMTKHNAAIAADTAIKRAMMSQSPIATKRIDKADPFAYGYVIGLAFAAAITAAPIVALAMGW